MDLVSKGIRTDILLDSLETQIENHPSHIVIRTPLVPDYHVGNSIVFKELPKTQDDLLSCIEVYKRGFDVAKQGFMHFQWDESVVCLDKSLFDKNAMQVFEIVTLSASDIHEKNTLDEKISFRKIDWNKDMKEWVNLHIDPDWKGASVEFQKKFWNVKALKMQQFQEIFQGHRVVATFGKKIIGDVGLYAFKKFARFHALIVHKDFRKQGVGANLLLQAVDFSPNNWSLSELIIRAQKNSLAEKLYASMGFVQIEDQIQATCLA